MELNYNNIYKFLIKILKLFVYRCNIIMPMYLLCRDYRKMCTIPIKYFTAKILREKMKKKFVKYWWGWKWLHLHKCNYPGHMKAAGVPSASNMRSFRKEQCHNFSNVRSAWRELVCYLFRNATEILT